MDLIICAFAFLILAERCLCQDYIYIDDIPIESYDHGDHQDNEMDLELLRTRRGRSPDSDPKEYFFRPTRSFDEARTFRLYQDAPRPQFHTSNIPISNRKRRSVKESSDPDESSIIGRVKNLGKPLEIGPLETGNLTEGVEKAESKLFVADKEVEINDFIRFRRSPLESVGEESRGASSDQERNLPNLDPLTEKLVMDPPDDINRESRGAKVEHWMKNVYPVSKGDEVAFNDNLPSSSDSIRAPRVHFVTQNFEDNRLAHSELRPYEREARARYFDRESERAFAPERVLAPERSLVSERALLPERGLPPRDLDREMTRDNPYRRRFRSYGPLTALREPERGYYRDEVQAASYDPRGDYRDYYRPRYDSQYRTRNDYTAAPMAKPSQKRIIYYATLPEVSRTPPNVNLRDRYRYEQYRYDDRYLNDPYRYRANYPKAARYEEENKAPYPVKVLTDVNVREVKKNPERRIYSEADRNRYAYNTPPYRAADG
ncbi:uncharacterized protein [Euwallacea similis]|uniref:uncharacterized protein n=1 Tax=Euwallacea similis TaxID=1736056 RepID=UPI00344DE170